MNSYGVMTGGSWSPPYTAEQIAGYNGSYNPAGVKIDSFTYRYFQRDLFHTAEWKAAVVVDGEIHAVAVLFAMFPHAAAVMVGQDMTIVH